MLVNVTIPVFNEEERLKLCIPKLRWFLAERCRFDFEIVIADNASTDRTFDVAQSYSAAHASIRAIHLHEKGRGRAVKQAWSESSAGILSYMDVDLSTDLAAFPPLIEGLLSGGYDVAAGSRRLNPTQTSRGWKREIISRCYIRLVRMLFRTNLSDFQCGFKAITRKAADALLPVVEDNHWFMDTELLILAETLGYRIFELPVRWVENTDTRVKVWRTAWADIRGLLRLRRSLARGRYRLLARKRPWPPGSRAVQG
jgi:glycosyltransferase involved in cell wall biosynthesis